MTDLVIGAAGFVGPHLVAHLRARGRSVVTVDVAPSAEIDAVCDITDPAAVTALVTRLQPRRVFHLAAISSPSVARGVPERTVAVNVLGTLHLLTALRTGAPGARMLFASTSAVYGHVPEAAVPLREERRPYLTGPYEASKALGERLCALLGRDDRLQVVSARAFNHTGPGQTAEFVVPALAARVVEVATSRTPPLIRTGNLHPRRDFTDVRDVVRAYDELLDRGRAGAVYNVCSGQARTIRSIVDDLLRLAGVAATVEVNPAWRRDHDVEVLAGDTARLRGAIGWAPDPMGDRTLADVLGQAREAVEG